MKKDNYLTELHIGSMIKEVALKREISSKDLAASINLDKDNADKIYKKKDMHIINVVRLSYALEYNLLKMIAEKYLSHLPEVGNMPEQADISLTLDTQNRSITYTREAGNCNFLSKIDVGKHIQRIAESKGWNEQFMAKLLGCSQSSVCHLYHSSSIKVKRLIEISNRLNCNLISDIYLSRMIIAPSLDTFDNCIITLNKREVRVLHPNDKTFLIVYQRKDNEER